MPIGGALTSLLLVMVAMSGPYVSTNAQPAAPAQAPIRVISSTHEVYYPDEVVFRLLAEAVSPITEVTFFYILARQGIKVYGYPDFIPGRRVSADFSLKTSGGSYIPSGVDIEYYYQIGDEDGNTLVTQRFLLEYRDPGYRWQELRYEELVLLWHDLPVGRVREVAENVGLRLKAVKELLGQETVPPMKAVVLNSRREADRGFPFVSQAAKAGYLYGGFAFPDFGLFMLVGLSEDAMVHEATHLLVSEALDSPLARLPTWLNEGLAMYFESNSRGREATLARALRDGALMSLGSMNSVPGRPEDVTLFYAQSWSVVKYMMDTYGTKHMGELLGAVNAGANIEAAILDVHGINLEELERQWEADVKRALPPATRLDIGTIATSGIVASALVIALAASLLRWVWRRADQLRTETHDS